MNIRFGLTATPETDKKLTFLTDLPPFEVKNHQELFLDLEAVFIGIICVWESGKEFHGIKPSYSKKYRSLGFGIYLDHDTVMHIEGRETIWNYVCNCIDNGCKVLETEKVRGLNFPAIVNFICSNYRNWYSV